MPQATPQTFSAHLYELWRRLAYSLLVLIAGGTFAYFERDFIITKFQQPLHMPLFYTSPSGSFQFVMQVCVMAGVFMALPVLVYNLLRFIEPAFSTRRLSRTRMAVVILTSVVLALGGIAFGYFIILPTSFHFFAGFSIGGIIKPLISVSEYFTFVLSCLVSFAVIFQLPLIMLFINSIRRFPPGKLRKYRRHIIVGSFVLALVLPFTYDPITQFIMAMPIILLFEISLLLIWWVNRKHHKKAKEMAMTQPQQVLTHAKSRPHTQPAPTAPKVAIPLVTAARRNPTLVSDFVTQPRPRPQPTYISRPLIYPAEQLEALSRPTLSMKPLYKPRLIQL